MNRPAICHSSDSWNNQVAVQLVVTDRIKSLTTCWGSNANGRAHFRQIPKRHVKTTVNCGDDSELDPFGYVQPMKFIMQGMYFRCSILPSTITEWWTPKKQKKQFCSVSFMTAVQWTAVITNKTVLFCFLGNSWKYSTHFTTAHFRIIQDITDTMTN